MTIRGVGVVRRSFAVALLLLLPFGAVADAQTAPATALRDVSVTTQPDSVTIVVKTTGEVKYQAELMDRPHRLVLDFDDTSYGWRKTPLTVTSEPLKQIRGSQYRRGVSRVVLAPTRQVGYAIREEHDGLAIVIPTAVSARPAEPAASTTAARPAAPKAPTAAAAPKPSAPVVPPAKAKAPEPARVAQ